MVEKNHFTTKDHKGKNKGTQRKTLSAVTGISPRKEGKLPVSGFWEPRKESAGLFSIVAVLWFFFLKAFFKKSDT